MAGRRAIVVGGAGGIGRAVCHRLAEDGYAVVVADIDHDGAAATCRDLSGEDHLAAALDSTDEHAVDTLFDALESNAPAAVLVTITGGLVGRDRPSTICDMSSSEWNRTLALNITGTFHCVRKFAAQRTRAPLDDMRIITFSSVAGQIGGASTGIAYSTGKAAVMGFTRQAASELAAAGITVNSIAPGAVGTPQFYHVLDAAEVAGIEAAVPLGRVSAPSEIAAIVSFLASKDSSYITGTTLDANGGFRFN